MTADISLTERRHYSSQPATALHAVMNMRRASAQLIDCLFYEVTGFINGFCRRLECSFRSQMKIPPTADGG